MHRIAGLLLLLVPLVSAADVVAPIESVENHINIRMSADARSEIVGRLNQGDYLPLVKSIPDWHEVEIAGGATGFISADWSVVLDAPPAEDEEVAVTTEDAESVHVPVEEAVADAEEDPVADSERTIEEDVVEAVQPLADPEVPTAEATVAAPDPAVAPDTRGDDAEEVELGADDLVAPDNAVIQDVDQTLEEDAVVRIVEDVAANDDNVIEIPAAQSDPELKPVVNATHTEPATQGLPGLPGLAGPQGETGPQGPAGAANIEGGIGYLAKFTAPTTGGSSQVFDDGNNIGIGTREPKQRLEVNGNIQIHERNSSVAGLMITQSDGETGYVMHNRASTLTIGAGSVDRITIDRDGNVGFGVARPKNPLEMASGAHVTAGGVWTNSSSRERKENIAELSLDDALSALLQLEPVHFNYKNDRMENYLGFIAEDVPELVATGDRDGLSSMDIVAVLTRVVQEQQKKIEALEAKIDQR